MTTKYKSYSITLQMADGKKHKIPIAVPVGEKGEKGEKGDKGDRGTNGKDGYTPQKGVDYFDGKDGAKGEKGDKGDKGADGTMSFEDLTDAQKEALKGEKGDKGEKGAQGDKGDKGDKGDPGTNGINGKDGAVGIGIYLGYITYDSNAMQQKVASSSIPSGREYQIGDLIIDQNDGSVYSVVNIENSTAYVEGGTYSIKGADGANGKNGENGKTPVKGTDYFTEADKSEMVNAVIVALPIYNGEVVTV